MGQPLQRPRSAEHWRLWAGLRVERVEQDAPPALDLPRGGQKGGVTRWSVWSRTWPPLWTCRGGGGSGG
eukprot:1192987-Prorocentrum_minimum.AAC.1